MTGGSADPVSLSWLQELAIQDQVALMSHPRPPISGEVAGHIVGILGGYAVVMQLHGPSDRWEAVRSVSKPAKPSRAK